MNLGQLKYRRARYLEDANGDERVKSCIHCTEPIGQQYYCYLEHYKITDGGERIYWGYSTHLDCLIPYVIARGEKYEEEARQRQLARGTVFGRPRLNLDPEQRRIRWNNSVYMGHTRRKLMFAYESKNEHKIKEAKRRYAKMLRRFLDNKDTWGQDSGIRLAGSDKETISRMGQALVKVESHDRVQQLNDIHSMEPIPLVELIGWLEDGLEDKASKKTEHGVKI